MKVHKFIFISFLILYEEHKRGRNGFGDVAM